MYVFQALQSFVNLRKFEIIDDPRSDCMKHINMLLEAITLHGEKLEELKIYSMIFNAHLQSKHFQHFPNLQKITLYGDKIQFDNELFKTISTHCTKLKFIELSCKSRLCFSKFV